MISPNVHKQVLQKYPDQGKMFPFIVKSKGVFTVKSNAVIKTLD